MKKFFRGLLLFFITLVILACCGEYYLDNYPSIFQQNINYIQANSLQIEGLVLGSSHSHDAINPEDFKNKKVVNLAFGGQDLILDSKLLNK